MYRCVALATLQREGEPGAIAAALRIELGERVLLDGEDVSAAIRTAEVSQRASEIAVLPEVRAAMVIQQRRLLADGDWVAEGRDIGTVVAPGAELKIFLTAEPVERARRRAAELGMSVDAVLADQQERDQRDRTRKTSPLMPASDAVSVDSTNLSLAEVVAKIASLAPAHETQQTAESE
jgi:cytidylate kinase